MLAYLMINVCTFFFRLIHAMVLSFRSGPRRHSFAKTMIECHPVNLFGRSMAYGIILSIFAFIIGLYIFAVSSDMRFFVFDTTTWFGSSIRKTISDNVAAGVSSVTSTLARGISLESLNEN